jgi:hypothetical protein
MRAVALALKVVLHRQLVARAKVKDVFALSKGFSQLSEPAQPARVWAKL